QQAVSLLLRVPAVVDFRFRRLVAMASACRGRGSAGTALCAGAALLACVYFSRGLAFFAASPRSSTGGRPQGPRVATHLHNTNEGGAVPSEVTATAPPAFEEQAIMAIEDCMSHGPSVESLARLDVKLLSLDQQLEAAIQQQTGGDELAHLIGVRHRVGTLRSQMEALQGVVAYILYNPQD
ncbi:unnamed protein product, partial [Prorocentrum cordatum]